MKSHEFLKVKTPQIQGSRLCIWLCVKVKCDEYLTHRIQQPILNLRILIFFSIFLVIPIMFDKENNNEY